MAHHKSAIRQHRRSLRRNSMNKESKTALRSHVKKLREHIKNKNKEEALKLLPTTFSVIDQTVKKGVIHENKGSRYKRRLSRQIELITSSTAK